jgi:hypothetical protein
MIKIEMQFAANYRLIYTLHRLVFDMKGLMCTIDRYLMVLPRMTKTYATYSDPGPPFGPPGPRNLYRLLHPNAGPDGIGEKITKLLLIKTNKVMSCNRKSQCDYETNTYTKYRRIF